MKNVLELIAQTRKAFSFYFKSMSLEQLNEIPNGMSNNIIWNAGHVAAVTQGLCYGLSGLPQNLPKEFIMRFKRGSLAEVYSPQDVELIKHALKTTTIQLIQDYEAGVFKHFKPYTTGTNSELKSIEDAIAFDLFHTGYHIGVCQAIIKQIKG